MVEVVFRSFSLASVCLSLVASTCARMHAMHIHFIQATAALSAILAFFCLGWVNLDPVHGGSASLRPRPATSNTAINLPRYIGWWKLRW